MLVWLEPKLSVNSTKKLLLWHHTVVSWRHNVFMCLRGVSYGEMVSRIGAEEGIHRDKELHWSKDHSSETKSSTGEKIVFGITYKF